MASKKEIGFACLESVESVDPANWCSHNQKQKHCEWFFFLKGNCECY